MPTKDHMTKLLEIHENYIEKLLQRADVAYQDDDRPLANLLRDAAALLTQHADDIRETIADEL